MPFYVYILACFKDKIFSCYYTGQTDNLYRRTGQHFDIVCEKDTNHFVGRFDFVKLIWHRVVDTREDALRLESYLKQRTPPEKESYMDKFGTRH